MKYEDHKEVQQMLSNAQAAEEDIRENVREVIHFLKKDDGQWEPSIVSKMSGRPRYTFDKCNPVVDSIAGELEQVEFSIKVRPAGGDASKETAALFDGMIRNIQAISNAEQIYNASGRKMVECGFDAWLVVQDWADPKSFEQDLLIKKIANAVDRVWFDENAEQQDMSDAMHGFLLHSMTKEKYKEKWPEGKATSIGDPKTQQVYQYKRNSVIVGQIYYKKEKTIELVLMSNNKVYEVNDDFEKVKDELAAQGITEKRRRNHKSYVVMSRLFDGDDFLNEPQETVFSYIPIIPVYGNFDISEDKVIYRGAIEKLMDSQRVYNYAQSRAIEEGALAPRGKFWMTRAQGKGNEDKLQTLNTNADPVQFYNHVEGEPPPFWTGGAQINSGLSKTSEDMKGNIVEGSGVFAANQGNAPNQSGYAIELQQNKGDNSTIKYFSSQEVAINHTAKILVDAIPKVYDTSRTIRVLGEDGASKLEKINDVVVDNQTQQTVKLNDLRAGKYDVVVDVGPAFKNRQQETARAFTEMAGIDPSIIQQGKDIWLSNLAVPGMDAMAERARKQMFEAGLIPDSQMTDDEKQRAQKMIAEAQAKQQNQQPTVMEQAVIAQTQAQTADVSSRVDERLQKIALQHRQQDLKEAQFSQQASNDAMQLILQQNKQIVDALNTQANTLKTLKEAMGKVTIISPQSAEAYGDQAELVMQTQEKVEGKEKPESQELQ